MHGGSLETAEAKPANGKHGEGGEERRDRECHLLPSAQGPSPVEGPALASSQNLRYMSYVISIPDTQAPFSLFTNLQPIFIRGCPLARP